MLEYLDKPTKKKKKWKYLIFKTKFECKNSLFALPADIMVL